MPFKGKPAAIKNDELPKPFVEGKPDWTEVSLFGWQCAFHHAHYREGIPGPWYMDNGANPEGMWVWDSCFIAMYARYLPDIIPGIDSLDNYYGWQREDGYISMAYDFAGQPRYGDRINPPLFAWAEWLYYKTTGRTDRIERVLPHLIGFYNWIFNNRSCEDFELYWFEDAGSSGMDNSPRGRRDRTAGQHMGWVDLSCQMGLLALYISRLAKVAGQAGIVSRFECDWDYHRRHVEKYCWCPRSRFYHDRLDHSNWLGSKTAAGFWPMIAEFASAERVDALCEHLENPATFGRPWPVPTLSCDDPNYEDMGEYWLGGVWPPTNYMVAAGLWKQGRYELARKIAGRFLEQMARVYKDYTPCPGTIWEAYAPEHAEPANYGRTGDMPHRKVRKDFCGWSSIGVTAMFYEHVLGLEADVPENTLTWRVGLTEKHGIERYPFGNAQVDLTAEKRSSEEAEVKIRAKASTDLTLIVECAGREKKTALKKGKEQDLTV